MSESERADALQEERTGLPSAERLKAFTDAVVAIAMTLLILPLMDSVGEAGRKGQTAPEWIADDYALLFTFVLSFVLIAAFWLSHHRLFAQVHAVTPGLLVLTVAWMFTIVWMPVATAIVGRLPEDWAQKVLYIGSLFCTNFLLAVLGWCVLRHPAIHGMSELSLRRGILADLVASALFLVALAIAIFVPVIDYWALAVLMLTGPVGSFLGRQLGLSKSRKVSARKGR